MKHVVRHPAYPVQELAGMLFKRAATRPLCPQRGVTYDNTYGSWVDQVNAASGILGKRKCVV